MDNLIEDLSKHSKSIGLSFLSRYEDNFLHKQGITFVAGTKRIIYLNDNMLEIREHIASKPTIHFKGHVLPELVLNKVREYVK